MTTAILLLALSAPDCSTLLPSHEGVHVQCLEQPWSGPTVTDDEDYQVDYDSDDDDDPESDIPFSLVKVHRADSTENHARDPERQSQTQQAPVPSRRGWISPRHEGR